MNAVAWTVLVPLHMLARWSLLLPVIAIEHRGTLAALGRSSDLVLPARWKVFAVVTTSLALGTALSFAVAAGIESAASRSVAFWLEQAFDALVISTLVVVVPVALYYELTAALRSR